MTCAARLTMLSDLARRPWRLPCHAACPAAPHRQVHAVPALAWLRAPFGDGGSLLHLVLHPLNVLLSPRGPVLIDWEGAGCGPAATGLALTWVLVATGSVPGPPRQRTARPGRPGP